MNSHRLKTSTVITAFAVPVCLILLGAGCFDAVTQGVTGAGQSALKVGQQVGGDVLIPAKASLEALQKAKEVAAVEKARQNEQTDMASDDILVPFVLTEKTNPPAGAKVADETFGCNDRIAMVIEHKAASTDSIMHDALLTLFGLHDSSTHTPLYNSLANGKLQIDKIQSADGVNTEVWIKGDIKPSGACDGPRIKAQLEATVARYRTHYKIFLNGSESTYRCLGDATGQCK
jgi:hypothetical protein